MLRTGAVVLGMWVLGVSTSAALAADLTVPESAPIAHQPSFYLHVGPAAVILDESARLKAAGQNVPGANIAMEPQATAVVEAGYFFTPNLAVSFTGGLPLHADIEAAGTMDGLGRVGETLYGPVALTAHYHFTGLGRVQPYLGLGPAFMYVFDDTDGLLTDLKIDHAFGFAFQGGIDLMLNERWGLFADAKKVILRTEASGSLGGVPIDADVTLDPLVVQAGLTFRF
jgi:outer membrane protein